MWDSKLNNFNEDNWFLWWFVGFTDGDGSFTIYANPDSLKINLTFKISQKSNNIQALYFLKSSLGFGKVRSSSKEDMSHFLIRDKETLKNKLIPIFENYPLNSSKYHSYILFKKALSIWDNNTYNQKEKVFQILELKSKFLTTPLKSYNWNKPWIIGFTEAGGSFYIIKKEELRLVHGFGITQKLDKHILEEFKKVFEIKASVKYNKKGFYSLDTTSTKSLKLIKKYYFKTMKTRKSLDYRIWARTFKYKGQYEKMKKIQDLLRKLRKK